MLKLELVAYTETDMNTAVLLCRCVALGRQLNIERHHVLSFEELRRIDKPPRRKTSNRSEMIGVSNLTKALVAPGTARMKAIGRLA